jgi:hypothetical protein
MTQAAASGGQALGACHGQHGQLVDCSIRADLGRAERLKHRLLARIDNLRWRLESKGARETVRYTLRRLLRPDAGGTWRGGRVNANAPPRAEQVLNLRPGDLVEVRSEEEILATLDERGTLRGLAPMSGMNRHCGKRYRVFKRLDTMILESTREYRRVRNTVLLEGVLCDGRFFNGCGRSCFYFWREAWLKRVEEPDGPGPRDAAGDRRGDGISTR